MWPEMESFVSQGIELPGETGLSHLEVVGLTQIANFEAGVLLTSEQVADFVREVLPPSHLERCPSIVYEAAPHPEIPGAMGLFTSDSHTIQLFGPAERYQDAGEMVEVLTHEIGHNVHQNILEGNPALAQRWAALHEQSRWSDQVYGAGFVTDYARTNIHEDFAESYKSYVHDPEALQFAAPEKYEFMRSHIFVGAEYAPAVHAYWDVDSAGNSIEVTGTGVYDVKGNRIAWSL